jgi:Neuraminidase (sialidase)
MCKMQYRWMVPDEIQIYDAFPAARYQVATAGGYFPIVDRLPGGRLVCVVREGDFHVGQRARLAITISDDGGESWSETHPITATNPDPCHTAFGCSAAGTMIVGYVLPHAYREGVWQAGEVRDSPIIVSRSEDGGVTWSDAATIDHSAIPEPSVHPNGRIVQLPDGTLLMNILTCWAADGGELGYNRERGFASYLLRSRDDGRTWGEPSLIGRDNMIETSFACAPSGTLAAAIRHYPPGQAHDVWLAESEDDGYTWGTPRPVTRPGDHPADLVWLRDGRLLLVYGQRRVPCGVRAMISHDGGKTWDEEHKLTLAAEGTTTDTGYPSAVQLDDGQVLVVYYLHESTGPFIQPGEHVSGPMAAAIKFRADVLP